MKTSHDWQKIITKWQSSGLTVKQFCQKHHLPVARFYYYRKKLESSSSTSSFLPAVIQEQTDSLLTITKGTLTLEVPLSTPGTVLQGIFSALENV